MHGRATGFATRWAILPQKQRILNQEKQVPSELPAAIRAVSIAVFVNDAFLLVQRARAPARGMFAFPGGRIEDGESGVEAAIRELREETGLSVTAIDPFDEIELVTADSTFALTVFIGHGVTGTLVAGDDAAKAGWYSLDEMASMPVTASTVAIANRIAQPRHSSD